MACVLVSALVKGWQSSTIFISVLTVVDLCMIVFMIILYLDCMDCIFFMIVGLM